MNGAEWLVITKLDVLDELEEIPVCIGYEIDGKVTDEIPADVHGLESIKPRYTTLKGWRTSTEGITDFEKLPEGGAGLPALPGAGERGADRNGVHRAGSGTDHAAAGVCRGAGRISPLMGHNAGSLSSGPRQNPNPRRSQIKDRPDDQLHCPHDIFPG